MRPEAIAFPGPRGPSGHELLGTELKSSVRAASTLNH